MCQADSNGKRWAPNLGPHKGSEALDAADPGGLHGPAETSGSGKGGRTCPGATRQFLVLAPLLGTFRGLVIIPPSHVKKQRHREATRGGKLVQQDCHLNQGSGRTSLLSQERGNVSSKVLRPLHHAGGPAESWLPWASPPFASPRLKAGDDETIGPRTVEGQSGGTTGD